MLDEPIASLDPLARREFLGALMEVTVEQGLSVVMSSHLVGDLERVCDYLVAGRVRLAGDVQGLIASHYRLTGPRRDPAALPAGWEVISASHTDRQSTLLVRAGQPVTDPAWVAEPVGLEDLILSYLSQAGRPAHDVELALEAQR